MCARERTNVATAETKSWQDSSVSITQHYSSCENKIHKDIIDFFHFYVFEKLTYYIFSQTYKRPAFLIYESLLKRTAGFVTKSLAR